MTKANDEGKQVMMGLKSTKNRRNGAVVREHQCKVSKQGCRHVESRSPRMHPWVGPGMMMGVGSGIHG